MTADHTEERSHEDQHEAVVMDREDRIVLTGVAFAALCFFWLVLSGQLPGGFAL